MKVIPLLVKKVNVAHILPASILSDRVSCRFPGRPSYKNVNRVLFVYNKVTCKGYTRL